MEVAAFGKRDHQAAVFRDERFEDARIVVLRESAEVGVAPEVVQEIRTDGSSGDIRNKGATLCERLDNSLLHPFAPEKRID